MCTGCCLQDYMGIFVMTETTWLDGNYSIIEGEAISLFEAMKAMEQRRISHVIFEMDSKSVVDTIQYLCGGNYRFSLLVYHINNLLFVSPNFVIKFIMRQTNIVVHTLARTTFFWSIRCTFETLPIYISSLSVIFFFLSLFFSRYQTYITICNINNNHTITT
jgi:hypothetical protein